MSSIIFPFPAVGIVGPSARSAWDAEEDKFVPDRDMGEAQDLGGLVQALGLLVGFDN